MAVNKIGEMSLDELIASGKSPLHTRVVKLDAGSGELKRGQLIGELSGTFHAITSGDTAYGILCDDVTLGSGTVDAVVYVSGHFNGNKVVGYVADTHYEDLRDKGIFVEKALAY